MTDNERALYYAERLAEMPPDVLRRAVDVLAGWIGHDDKASVREAVAKYGSHVWIHEGLHHFGWGMVTRNKLRDAGLLDDLLPMGNWDDYYVTCIEIACGARKMPNV